MSGGIKEDILEDIFQPLSFKRTPNEKGCWFKYCKKKIIMKRWKYQSYNEDNGAVFEIRLKNCEE